jgi:phytoene synthase
VSTASEITRKAKSNLAIALNILPRERREDMVVFYAFCRTMDDLADDAGVPNEERARRLEAWKHGIVHGFENPDDFQKEVIALLARYEIPVDLPVAIIDGCRMDLQPHRFQTWEDLSAYIWKVACAVGLVSIRIFGCTDPGSERYAVALGHALQLTNILRDIEEDLSNGLRIYLPLDDLARFNYSEQDLIARVRDERFLALMDYQAERTEAFYREAADTLPPGDHHALLPARIMAEIYHLLLGKIRTDHFKVFEKRYRVSKSRKLAILSKHMLTRSPDPD